MEPVDADLIIINASELVTLSGENIPRIGSQMQNLCIIKNGAIACYKDTIVAVGTTDELLELVNIQGMTIDAKNNVVMPGFVDPHTHLVFAGSRENEFAMKLQGKTYLEILEAGGGILSTVRATRDATIEELTAQSKIRLNSMLLHGTTTAEAKSGYGLTVFDEIKMLEAISLLDKEHPIDLIPTFLGAHAVPPEYDGKTDEYVDLIVDEMLPELTQKQLAEFCDVFAEEGIFSIEQSRRIFIQAKKLGLKIHIHADEIVCLGGAELAAELGAHAAGHLLQASETGMDALANQKVIAALFPSTPFFLMLSNYANAREMIQRGIPVALATDLNPNAWIESIQVILTLACVQMRMTPAEAITAATINAAYSIDRAKQIGSLDVGKKADIQILDAPNHEYIPYHFGSNLVQTVIKHGKLVVLDQQLLI